MQVLRIQSSKTLFTKLAFQFLNNIMFRFLLKRLFGVLHWRLDSSFGDDDGSKDCCEKLCWSWVGLSNNLELTEESPLNWCMFLSCLTLLLMLEKVLSQNLQVFSCSVLVACEELLSCNIGDGDVFLYAHRNRSWRSLDFELVKPTLQRTLWHLSLGVFFLVGVLWGDFLGVLCLYSLSSLLLFGGDSSECLHLEAWRLRWLGDSLSSSPGFFAIFSFMSIVGPPPFSTNQDSLLHPLFLWQGLENDDNSILENLGPSHGESDNNPLKDSFEEVDKGLENNV